MSTPTPLVINAFAAVGVAGALPVEIFLCDGNGLPAVGFVNSGVVVKTWQGATGIDGLLTVELFRNEDIDPANSCYLVAIGHGAAATRFVIQKKAGTEQLLDCLVASPQPLGSLFGLANLDDVDAAGAEVGQVLTVTSLDPTRFDLEASQGGTLDGDVTGPAGENTIVDEAVTLAKLGPDAIAAFDEAGSASAAQTAAIAAAATDATTKMTSAVTTATGIAAADATTKVGAEQTRATGVEATKFDGSGPGQAHLGTTSLDSQGTQFGPGMDRWHWALAQRLTRPVKALFLGDSEIEFASAFMGVSRRMAALFNPPGRQPSNLNAGNLFSAAQGQWSQFGLGWSGNVWSISVNATGGTWSMTLGGQTASGLARNISAASLQTALTALSSVGAGKATVTGGPAGTAALIVTFETSLLCPATGVSSTGLTGGMHTVSLAPATGTTVTNRGLTAYANALSDGQQRHFAGTFDRFRAYWLAGSAGSTWDIYLDGTLVASGLSGAAASHWDSALIPYVNHDVVMQSHGNTLLDGAMEYQGNYGSGIQTIMAGHSGDTAQNCAANWSDLPAYITAENPDLVVIEFGINDYGAGRTAAQFKADLETIIGEVTAQGASLALWIAQDVGSHAGLNATYLPVLQALSIEHGCPIINMAEHIASTATGDPLGITVGDNVHYSSLGVDIVSRATTAVLLTHERASTPALDATGVVPGLAAVWENDTALGQFTASIVPGPLGPPLLEFGAVGSSYPQLAVGPDLFVVGLVGSNSSNADTMLFMGTNPAVWQVNSAFLLNGLTGAVAGRRIVGSTLTGHPTSGSFSAGDLVWAADGRVWICTTAGSPGTWVDAGLIAAGSVTNAMLAGSIATSKITWPSDTSHVLAGDGSAMTGAQVGALLTFDEIGAAAGTVQAGTTRDWLWKGVGSGSGPSSLRFTDLGSGFGMGIERRVIATDTYSSMQLADFFGLPCINWGPGGNVSGADVVMIRSQVGVIAGFSLAIQGLTGATAAVRLTGATTTGKPTTGTFAKGDVVFDQTGKAWYCTVAGSPGTWVDLVTSRRLDEMAAPTAAVSLNSQKITSLANGSGAQDAAAFGQIPVSGTGSTNFIPGNTVVHGIVTKSGAWSALPQQVTAPTSSTTTQSRGYAAPFDVGASVTFTSLGVEVVTTVSGTGGGCRVGIYTDTGGAPGTLLADSGLIATTATGYQENPASSWATGGNSGAGITLAPGRYWVVVNDQGSATVPTLRCTTATALMPVAQSLTVGSATATTLPIGVRSASDNITAALPGTWSGTTAITTMPLAFAKAA